MTTRRFCDGCGTEIDKSYVQDRLAGSRKVRRDGRILEIAVEVTVGTGRTSPGGPVWNEGDLCRDCVIDTVLSLDTRPKYEAEVAS